MAGAVKNGTFAPQFHSIGRMSEPREPWMEDALCAQTDPEAFFPNKGGSTREAKRVCAECDVREQCLKYALEHGENFGIWGGLSERQRRKIRRAQGMSA